jgi:hypothetical protein
LRSFIFFVRSVPTILTQREQFASDFWRNSQFTFAQFVSKYGTYQPQQTNTRKAHTPKKKIPRIASEEGVKPMPLRRKNPPANGKDDLTVQRGLAARFRNRMTKFHLEQVCDDV